jgi:tetratricopeptide (TPR) repeat protein
MPDQPLIELELAGAYLDLRDFPAAQRHAERAVKLDPNNPEAHRALGTLFSATGNLTATLGEGQKAIDLAPNDVRNWVQMGALCYGIRRYSDAARYLRRALELDPSQVDANVNLADALFQVDLTPATRAEIHRLLARALTLDPTQGRALYLLGRQYLEEGKLDLAVPTLRRAVRWEPQSREAILALGQALSRQGQAEEGRALLLQAQHAIDSTVDFRGLEYQALQNPNPDVHVRLARLYMRSQRYDSALHTVERGLKLAPTDERLRSMHTELLRHPPRLMSTSGSSQRGPQ